MSSEEQRRERLAKLAQRDQINAEIAAVLPDLWWQIYSGCVRNGFTPDQSMEILKALIQKPT